VGRKGLKVELIADQEALVPGQETRIGVRFVLEPHWHVYWKEPYGPGKPTLVELEGPKGYAVGALSWPAPIVIGAGTPFAGWGYEEEVLLFAKVATPATAPEGEQATFSANVKWLACDKECIPGRATLAVRLPIRAASLASKDAVAFDRAASRLPLPAPSWLEVEVVRALDQHPPGSPFQLAVVAQDRDRRPITEAAFFAAPETGLRVAKVVARTEGSGIPPGGVGIGIAGEVSSDVGATGDSLEAVLVGKRGGEPFRVALDLAVPRVLTVARTHVLFPGLPAASGRTEAGTPGPAANGPAISQAASSSERARPQVCPRGADAASAAPALWWLVLLALAGGLILNVMPCVLPVLSIKILGIVQQSGEDRRRIRVHGVVYALGVYACFAVLGVFMVALAKGWGFQFQSPGFTATMGAMVLALGLSLFGVFEIGLPGADTLGAAATGRHGYLSSFINGAFAVLLGTACTAPVLGPALAAASTQPPLEQSVILFAIATGFHLPFLILAFVPAWRRLLPRPGAWMETFKKIMGFCLVGTAIFFLGSLRGQLSADAFKLYLVFLGVLAFAGWVYGHWGSPVRGERTRWIAMATALLLTAGGAAWLVRLEPPPKPEATATVTIDGGGSPVVDGHIQWRSFAAHDAYAEAEQGRVVFVDFTADWCVNCKTIEAAVIDTEEVKQALAEHNVLPLQADWTNEDELITEWLACYKGKPSVPMYLVIPAGRPDEAVVLPEWPSTEEVIEAIGKAAGSGSLALGPPAAQSE
jgi:thiol:disulfide interchange protein DsbD